MASTIQPTKPRVVLLHGLGRTQYSMLFPDLRLRSRGFETLNIRYPSLRKEISELADFVLERIHERWGDPPLPVNFLTHSLGGIVLRAMLDRDDPRLKLSSAVMLAPPNQGSSLAEKLGDQLLFRKIAGPAAQQLRRNANSVPEKLGAVEGAVGVITGDKAGTLWSFLVDGRSDGTITVEEAKLEGMRDFLVVSRGHSFIMNDPWVIDQAIHFFRTGAFNHAKQAPNKTTSARPPRAQN